MSGQVGNREGAERGAWRQALLAGLLLTVLVVWVLRELWLPTTDQTIYPWGSDTLGHLIKVEYLQQEIAAGHLYPNLFPAWYNGIQLLRYYPPLPYYLLVAINGLVGDVLAAGHWFVVGTALIGALSFLAFARWVGWGPAVLGALLLALAPDNLRVALAEGNLPRSLATAFLPGLTYCQLCLLTGEGGRRHALIGAWLVTAVILSHAMMGAIFGVSLGLVAVTLFLLGRVPVYRLLRALGMLAVGLALAGVWLLPSLAGGISELSQEAMTEALAVFPLSVYLNPFLRQGDREILYVGLGLVGVLFLGLLRPAGRRPIPLTFFLVGMATVLISTPGFNALFQGLPAHQLFWPIRFLSFSGLALLVALVFQLQGVQTHPRGRLILLSVAVILLLDTAPSLHLVFRRPPPAPLLAIAQELRERPGWRVATLDFSRLGSPPSYLFTALGGREQVFGWAYQGARTATNVAALNGALEGGAWGYALGALDRLGADDLVVWLGDERLARFAALLPTAGFSRVRSEQELALYHRDGGPRAFRVQADALGIGPGARNFATIFPGLEIATSPRVDDYDPAYLAHFRLLVLSRFSWRDQGRAEAIIRAYAGQGGEVLIDLSGTPDDPLAREPRFLNVYGERVRFSGEPIEINVDGERRRLLPFASRPWQAIVPQGELDSPVTLDYHGVSGTVLGFARYGSGRVWFVGLNLPYHTLLTQDPVGLAILSRVMTVPAGRSPSLFSVPLDHYQADRDGYRFDYTLAEEGDLIVPVADHGGSEIRVDGQVVASHSLDNLVGFTAPAGTHRVEIVFRPTAIYGQGALLSLVGVVVGGVGLLFWKRGAP